MLTLKQYILAGRAVFTVQSIRTGNRRTFRVNKCDPEKIRKPNVDTLHFVAYLSGPDNNASYTFLGSIVNGSNFFKRRDFSGDSVSMNAFTWLWTYAHSGKGMDELPRSILFYPSSRCCRCGRLLTTPESINNGIGPECMDRMF